MVRGEAYPFRVRVFVVGRRAYNASAPVFRGRIESAGRGGSVVTGTLGTPRLVRNFLVVWLTLLMLFLTLTAVVGLADVISGRVGAGVALLGRVTLFAVLVVAFMVAGMALRSRHGRRPDDDLEFLRSWLVDQTGSGSVRHGS